MLKSDASIVLRDRIKFQMIPRVRTLQLDYFRYPHLYLICSTVSSHILRYFETYPGTAPSPGTGARMGGQRYNRSYFHDLEGAAPIETGPPPLPASARCTVVSWMPFQSSPDDEMVNTCHFWSCGASTSITSRRVRIP